MALNKTISLLSTESFEHCLESLLTKLPGTYKIKSTLITDTFCRVSAIKYGSYYWFKNKEYLINRDTGDVTTLAEYDRYNKRHKISANELKALNKQLTIEDERILDFNWNPQLSNDMNLVMSLKKISQAAYNAIDKNDLPNLKPYKTYEGRMYESSVITVNENDRANFETMLKSKDNALINVGKIEKQKNAFIDSEKIKRHRRNDFLWSSPNNDINILIDGDGSSEYSTNAAERFNKLIDFFKREKMNPINLIASGLIQKLTEEICLILKQMKKGKGGLTIIITIQVGRVIHTFYKGDTEGFVFDINSQQLYGITRLNPMKDKSFKEFGYEDRSYINFPGGITPSDETISLFHSTYTMSGPSLLILASDGVTDLFIKFAGRHHLNSPRMDPITKETIEILYPKLGLKLPNNDLLYTVTDYILLENIIKACNADVSKIIQIFKYCIKRLQLIKKDDQTLLVQKVSVDNTNLKHIASLTSTDPLSDDESMHNSLPYSSGHNPIDF